MSAGYPMVNPLEDEEMRAVGLPRGDVGAPAVLERGRSGWIWLVQRCPFCGMSHRHGGGPIDRDPRGLLGHRWSHCAGDPPGKDVGYVLFETARFQQRLPRRRR